MELNKKLAELRKAKGLTQLEIAEALNVSRQAVSRWEVGTASPSLDNLAYLSRLYGVPLDDLVGGGDNEPAEISVDVPAAVPERTSRTAPICLFLAVLILGVGILIGLSLRAEPDKGIYLYALPKTDAGSQITVGGSDLSPSYVPNGGWLEKTPADLEDEARWLEETSGSISEKARILP